MVNMCVVVLMNCIIYGSPGVTCPEPELIVHGQINRNPPYYYMDRVTLTCDAGYGYYNTPNYIITCRGDKRWSSHFWCPGSSVNNITCFEIDLPKHLK